MNEYTPQSVIGWLAVDEEEADETRRLVSAFDESGTLDSLGIGAIRDGIANQLFPGTSTIQTRARYFLFVPWICAQIEDRKIPSGDFAQELRNRETALIYSLKKGAPGEPGIIGVEAGAGTQRLPSSVYWGGLGSWGIRTRDVSLREYARSLDDYYRHLAQVTREDDAEDPDRMRGTWTKLPTIPDGFPNRPISMQLTAEESAFLESKIALTHHRSQLDELVRRGQPPTTDWPWMVEKTDFSDELRRLLRHAEMFSYVIQGAQYLYCYHLAVDAFTQLSRNTEELAEKMRLSYSDWWTFIDENAGRIASWAADLADFWDAVTARGARVGGVRPFAENWIDMVRDGTTANIDDPRLRLLIQSRERRLKGGLARLSNPRALENWGGNEIGTAPLDYRWRNAQRIIADIVEVA